MVDRGAAPSQLGSDVFISYAREDSDIAEKLAAILEARGLSVWWDRDIAFGLEYDNVIESELDRARCVVVLWSTSSVTSRFVKAETRVGLDRNVLVPVFLEEVRPALEFRALQAAQLWGWKGEPGHPGMAKLVQRIHQLVGAVGPPVEEPPSNAPASPHAASASPSSSAPPAPPLLADENEATPLPQPLPQVGGVRARREGFSVGIDLATSPDAFPPSHRLPARPDASPHKTVDAIAAVSPTIVAPKGSRRWYAVVGAIVAVAGVAWLVWPPQPAVAKVDLSPGDAELLVDGQPMNLPASGELVGLKPGPHTFEARKKGFEPSTKRVELIAGQTVKESLVLSAILVVEPPPAVPSEPNVSSGEPNVRGSLDKEVIRRIIRRHINEVKYCYEQELTKKLALGGRIIVQFTIAASGQVIAAVLQNSTMGNARVENCTVQAVRRWEFPKPIGGGIVIVSYPFNFTPAGE